MRVIIIGLFVFLSACANQVQKEEKSKYTPINDEHLAAAKIESAIGKEIYRKDQYATKATDFMFEKGILPNDTRATGWIVDLQKDVPSVYFMGPSKNGPKNYHAVFFTDQGLKYAEEPKTFSLHQSMYRARMLGLENITLACSDRYNTVVIDTDESWLVYVMAATTDSSKIMAGGHHRIAVSKNSSEVSEVKPLSKTCIQLPNKPNALPWMTHIVDPTPIATHGFLSLLHNKTIYVGTETGAWKVENGNFSSME